MSPLIQNPKGGKTMNSLTNQYIFNPNTITARPNLQMPSVSPIGQSQQLISVNGLDSAKQYPMQPNSMVALFDANDDIMYIKQTDASNYPTIRIFKFTEMTMAEASHEPQYVTLDEFNKFKEELLNGQQFIRESAKSGANTNKNGQSKKHDADV